MSEYVLELKGITKIFPGVKALNNVQFQLKPGEVHALMGRPQSFREIIKGSRHKELIHGLIQGMGCCGNRKEQGNGADSRGSPHDGPGH